MVHFVGAGPGAPDLITQRGATLLQAADCIIYAGSLVNPALLGLARADCAIYNSAEMTLEQVGAVMKENEAAHKDTVRLHTGTPACTARYASRWICWMCGASPTMIRPACRAFAVRRRR